MQHLSVRVFFVKAFQPKKTRHICCMVAWSVLRSIGRISIVWELFLCPVSSMNKFVLSTWVWDIGTDVTPKSYILCIYWDLVFNIIHYWYPVKKICTHNCFIWTVNIALFLVYYHLPYKHLNSPHTQSIQSCHLQKMNKILFKSTFRFGCFSGVWMFGALTVLFVAINA